MKPENIEFLIEELREARKKAREYHGLWLTEYEENKKLVEQNDELQVRLTEMEHAMQMDDEEIRRLQAENGLHQED